MVANERPVKDKHMRTLSKSRDFFRPNKSHWKPPRIEPMMQPIIIIEAVDEKKSYFTEG